MLAICVGQTHPSRLTIGPHCLGKTAHDERPLLAWPGLDVRNTVYRFRSIRESICNDLLLFVFTASEHG